MTNLNRFKYPRTLHLPFSPGATSDDKMLTPNQTIDLYQDKHILKYQVIV